MLTSPDTIKAQGEINYNVDDAAIGAAIRSAQDIYLRDVIGTALKEKLQELVYNAIEGFEDNIESEDRIAYKTLLDEYVCVYLNYKVAAELCTRLTYKLRNFGEIKTSSINIGAADLNEVCFVRDKMEVGVNDASNRMMEFICENKDAFPEAVAKCGCDTKPVFAATNLWLGPEKK